MAAGGIGLPLIREIQSILPGSDESRFNLSLFSKPLDKYDFDFICECVSNSGIKGIDLTVRKAGKVEPESVESSLPRLIAKAGKHNLKVEMIVTGIATASDPLTEKILRTASGNGVRYYRLNWFDYDYAKGIWETLQAQRTNLKDIVTLNRKYNIHGGYQNHSGGMIGGPVWDLHELFRDFPPEFLGSQYDVRHAMVEGAYTWMIGMRLISPYIKTLAVKDFIWQTNGSKPEPVTVPLGEGMIDWDIFFKLVKDLNITAPLTLHVEYPLLEKNEEELPLLRQLDIIVRKLKKDADFIKGYLNKYQLTKS